MISKTPQEFQSIFLDKISFSAYQEDKNENCTIYKNKTKPELGYLIKYSRNEYYDFKIGDYTIPEDFSVFFNHKDTLMRFGTVYSGNTEFEIENSSVSSFSPSSFFVVEKDIKGKQFLKKGQHFHGAEITIYEKYFNEVIKPSFSETVNFKSFIDNYTYNYLPLEIASIIQKLKSMAEAQKLTSIYLESKILEAISLLYNEITFSPQSNAFTNQINYGQIKIGKNRYVSLTNSDVKAIKNAYDILTQEACNPPTIKSLSKIVFLNEQKLKCGFKAKYHMSINQYTTSIRMAMAENLLSTTELTVEEISEKLGYNYSSNFVKMFKKTHGKTPLAFKKQKLSNN